MENMFSHQFSFGLHWLNPTVYVAVACCIVHPLYTDKVSGTKNPEKLYRLKKKKNKHFVLENCVKNPVFF